VPTIWISERDEGLWSPISRKVPSARKESRDGPTAMCYGTMSVGESGAVSRLVGEEQARPIT
jgi:hypothetical protein